jgi:SAM-dependent methyltransferase
MDEVRRQAQELAREYVERGDAVGWFEPLYERAAGDPGRIQWADLAPNPQLVVWLDREGVQGEGRRALVVGCGLGDDAEFVAALGFAVTAFDSAPTAISMARVRHPGSWVAYEVADVLAPPEAWRGAFALVVESFTVQALPPGSHARAISSVRGFLAPGGTLLVIASAADEPPTAGPPFPLTRAEMESFGFAPDQIERVADGALWRAELTR